MEYLLNKSWSEINHEKKYATAELFFEIRKNTETFLDLCGLGKKEYDIAFEVRFFKEFIQEKKKSCFEGFDIPISRIFNLALISPTEIIIIETSTEKNFSFKKLAAISEDVKYMQRVCMYCGIPRPAVIHIAVCSSKYHTTDASLKHFNKIISWSDLSVVYPEKESVFKLADQSYITLIERDRMRYGKCISYDAKKETRE
jgi:hypothetical protein